MLERQKIKVVGEKNLKNGSENYSNVTHQHWDKHYTKSEKSLRAKITEKY
jgi:hypothetical protein